MEALDSSTCLGTEWELDDHYKRECCAVQQEAVLAKHMLRWPVAHQPWQSLLQCVHGPRTAPVISTKHAPAEQHQEIFGKARHMHTVHACAQYIFLAAHHHRST
jgi:hypothetical protein